MDDLFLQFVSSIEKCTKHIVLCEAIKKGYMICNESENAALNHSENYDASIYMLKTRYRDDPKLANYGKVIFHVSSPSNARGLYNATDAWNAFHEECLKPNGKLDIQKITVIIIDKIMSNELPTTTFPNFIKDVNLYDYLLVKYYDKCNVNYSNWIVKNVHLDLKNQAVNV